MLSAQLAAETGASLAWARIFHLYGPFEHEHRLVPAVIRTLLDGREFAATAGTQVRDYLHVADVASALRALLVGGADGAFNICSSKPTSVRDVIETIAQILDRPDSVRFGAVAARSWDPAFLCGDNTKLVRETGWGPAYQLRAGLEQTAAWWRALESRT
jgi:nucleoside-diphosphate-sugar epimerase